MQLHQTDVDGVPTFWSSVPGQLTAGLLFRAGRADETLARSGLCHLVEHLALHKLGLLPHAHNGHVDATMTMFVTAGSGDEIVRFLAGVTGALHDLPFDRLETERGVLRAEHAQQDPGLVGQLSVWRYGAATWGLVGYEEFGLGAIDEQQLRMWVGRYYSRGNAALWLSGPPPSELRLDLPDGPAVPCPIPSDAVQHTPAWFPTQGTGTGFSLLVQRSSAAMAYTALLGQHLQQVLRHERGQSYSPLVFYDRRDKDTAHVLGIIDALSEHADPVLQTVVSQVDGFARREVDQDALGRWRQEYRELRDDPGMQRGFLHSSAWDAVIGAPQMTPEKYEQERAAVSADDVAEVAHAAADLALYAAPNGCEPRETRVVSDPAWSTVTVEGRRFGPVPRAFAGQRLVVGDQGVSRQLDEKLVTVRYDSCAAVLAWPDGRRAAFGDDGFVVDVEPVLWRRGRRLVELVDAAAPSDLVVPMPARAEGDVPSIPFTQRRDVRLAGWMLLALVAVVLLLALLAVVVNAVPALAIPLSIGAVFGLVDLIRESRKERS